MIQIAVRHCGGLPNLLLIVDFLNKIDSTLMAWLNITHVLRVKYLSGKVVCHSSKNGFAGGKAAVVVNLKVGHDVNLLQVEDNHQAEPKPAQFTLEWSKYLVMFSPPFYLKLYSTVLSRRFLNS